MAEPNATVEVKLSDEMKAELNKVSENLSEMRIRQIIREELEQWEKSLVRKIRTQQGIRSDV